MNPDLHDPDFDAALRAALRRRAPPRDLAAAVLARSRRPRLKPRPRRWAPAFAVVLLLAAAWMLYRRQAVLRRRAEARADAVVLAGALRLAAADLNRIRLQVAP